MKKQLLTALFILCAVCAEAQVIWTVKAGAGISNFYSGPQSVAWKAGLGVDIPLSDKFMFMPAAEIAGKQVLTSYYGYVNGGYNVTDTDYDHCIFVQIPLQVGYKLRMGTAFDMNFKAGPYLAIPTDYGKFDYGIDAGIDFGYKHFVTGIDFQAGLANQSDDIRPFKTTALFFTLGYRF